MFAIGISRSMVSQNLDYHRSTNLYTDVDWLWFDFGSELCGKIYMASERN